jgi:hypothetical protein
MLCSSDLLLLHTVSKNGIKSNWCCKDKDKTQFVSYSLATEQSTAGSTLCSEMSDNEKKHCFTSSPMIALLQAKMCSWLFE